MTALLSLVANIVYTSVVSRDLSVLADCDARIAIRISPNLQHPVRSRPHLFSMSAWCLNSMMLPAGFPAAPPVSFLCCHRRGPPPEFAHLSDRRMEWSPVRDPISSAWAPQWICVQCSRTVDSSILPGVLSTHVLSVPRLPIWWLTAPLMPGGCGVSSARGVRISFPSR